MYNIPNIDGFCINMSWQFITKQIISNQLDSCKHILLNFIPRFYVIELWLWQWISNFCIHNIFILCLQKWKWNTEEDYRWWRCLFRQGENYVASRWDQLATLLVIFLTCFDMKIMVSTGSPYPQKVIHTYCKLSKWYQYFLSSGRVLPNWNTFSQILMA